MLSSRHMAIYMGGLIGPLGGLAVLTLFPVLKDEFDVGIDLIQLSIPFFMLPFAFFQLFSGTVSDKVGRGGILIGGFVVHSAGSFMCALSTDLAVFLGGRLVQGVGFAFVSPVLNALVGDITDKRRMGSAMGIFGATITLGIALGPLVAGFLEGVDWRLAFHLFGVLALVEIGAIVTAFGRDFTKIATGKGRGRGSAMGGMATAVADRSVLLLCAAGFLAFFGYIGPQTYMADRYSIIFQPQEIGYVLSTPGFVGIFWAPVAGRLVDRVGRVPVGIAGLAVVTVSLLALAYAVPLWSFILAFAFVGLGTSTLWASLMTLAVEVIPSLKGTVASVYNSARFFGYALASPIFLVIYMAQGVFMVYAVGAAATLAGLVAVRAMRFREPGQRRGPVRT